MEPIITLLKRSSWIYILQILAMPLGYLTRVIYAQKFSVKEFGLFMSLFEFYVLLSFIINFGIASAVAYVVPRLKEKNSYSRISFILLFAIIFQTLLYIIITFGLIIFKDFLVINYFKTPIEDHFFIAFGFFLYILNLFNLFQSTLISLSMEKHFAISDFIRNLLIFICSFVYLYIFIGDLIGVAWIYGFSYLIMIFYQVFSILKKNPKLKKIKVIKEKSTIVSFLSYSVYSFFSDWVFVLFTKVDIIFITALITLEAVGYYVNSITVAFMLLGIFTPLTRVLFPLVSSYSVKNKKNINEILSTIYNSGLAIVIPSCIFLFIFSKEIILLVFSDKYYLSIFPLKILAFGVLFNVLYVYNSSIIGGLGFAKKRFNILVAGLICNIILNFIFIKKFGIEGAALATSISYLFIWILSQIAIKRYTGFRLRYFFVFKIICANLIFVPLLFLGKIQLPFFEKLAVYFSISAVASAIYLVVIFYLKVIDKKLIMEFIRKMKS